MPTAARTSSGWPAGTRGASPCRRRSSSWPPWCVGNARLLPGLPALPCRGTPGRGDARYGWMLHRRVPAACSGRLRVGMLRGCNTAAWFTARRGWQCRARACTHPAAGCGRAAARGAGAHAGARRAGRPAPAVPQLAGRPRGRAGAARARPRRVAGGRPGRGACAARGWPAAPAGWGPSLASSVHVLPPQGPATLPVTESC